MTILAIDPGTRRFGWALVNRRPETLECGALEVTGVAGMAREVDALLVLARRAAGRQVDEVVVEQPGFWLRGARNKNMAGVAGIEQAVGAAVAVAAVRGLPVLVVADDRVKYYWTGRGQSAKHHVHAVLLLSGNTIPQLKNQTCADCRGAGGRDDHSPDAADAASIVLAAADPVFRLGD